MNARAMGDLVAEVAESLHHVGVSPRSMSVWRTLDGGYSVDVHVDAAAFHVAADVFVLGHVTVFGGMAFRGGRFGSALLTVCCGADALAELDAVSP